MTMDPVPVDRKKYARAFGDDFGRRIQFALLLSCLLLAFALRVYRLNGQSFWSDEGASMTMAGRSLAEIVKAAAADIHPPLYYILLHWWSLPAGNGEFALRFLSVGCDLLLVVLLFKLGERLFGAAVGLSAAFVAAIAPFLVYYAQEARMYAQMAFLSTLSVYLFLRLLEAIKGGQIQPPRPAQEQAGPHPNPLPEGEGTDPLSLWERVRVRVPLDPTLPLLWLAYIAATSAATYTQYFAFSVVIFQNLWFLIVHLRTWRIGLRRQARNWTIWIAAQVAVVLLYVPWLLQSMRQLTGWPSISESFGLATLLRRVFLVFSFGISWDMTATTKTELLLALIFAASLLSLLGFRHWSGDRLLLPRSETGSPGPTTDSHLARYAFTGLYLATPVLTMYLLSLQRPMYNPKMLLLATPPYYLLLGLGVVSLARFGRRLLPGRWTPGVLSGLVMGAIVVASLGGVAYATSRSLNAYYFNPKYARDDYRGLAKMVTISEREKDAIILNAPGQQEIFGYYYHGPQPVFPLPKQRPIDEAATAADLDKIAASSSRVWLVLWAVDESDPHSFIEGWLNEHAFKTDTRWFGNVRLVLYTIAKDEAGIDHPVQAGFGDQIRLLGYSLASADGDQTSAGGVLRLTLFWQATQKIDQRYTVFTHLIDDHEHIWGQRDSEPGGGARLTTDWQVGEVISDNYGLPVYLGTPPGEYKVEIGLYNAADGQRLAVHGDGGQALGDRLLIGPVHLGRPAQPPDTAALFVEHPLDSSFGPLHLVGFDFYKLGFDRGIVDFRTGDIAHLALYWEAKDKPGAGYTVDVQVVDRNGEVVFDQESDPADGNYPSSQWERGEVVRDQHKIPLNLPPGQYRLLAGLKRGGQIVKTGNDVLLTLAQFGVQSR